MARVHKKKNSINRDFITSSTARLTRCQSFRTFTPFLTDLVWCVLVPSWISLTTPTLALGVLPCISGGCQYFSSINRSHRPHSTTISAHHPHKSSTILQSAFACMNKTTVTMTTLSPLKLATLVESVTSPVSIKEGGDAAGGAEGAAAAAAAAARAAMFAKRTAINQEYQRYFAAGICSLIGVFIFFHWTRHFSNKGRSASPGSGSSFLVRPFKSISRFVLLATPTITVVF